MKSSGPVRIAGILLVITIIWIAFEHMMGYNTTRHDIGQYTRGLPMLLFWISIFFVVRNEKRSRGGITFNEGLKAGMMTSLLFAAGFAFIIFLYQQFVNPEFYSTFKAFSLSELQQQKVTQDVIDAKMKEIDMSYNGGALSFLLLFIFCFVWGLALSAIASLVYRRKKI